MVSAGQDLKMAVWDIRMFKEVNKHSLGRPGTSVAISDRGLTAVGWGTQVTIWRNLFTASTASSHPKIHSPYMAWGGAGKRIERVRWCPFEDILGISHSAGFSSIIVPGAGEANFDALELNPYETTKQRQEAEVKALLNKLQPEMISRDADFIGTLDPVSADARKKEQDLDREPEDAVAAMAKRGRGKNSSLRKFLRKKGGRNVVDEKRVRVEELRKAQRGRAEVGVRKREEEFGPALARFARKGGAGR